MAVLRRGGVAAVVTAVMAVHTLWIAIYVVAGGHESRDFVHIGLYWIARSGGASHDIVYDPTYHYQQSRGTNTAIYRGYDGQFAYYIALDPRNARYYLDAPSYRYSRILYPLAAWTLAAGNDEVIPYAMVVVNWLAVLLGTTAVALLLRRRGASAWWAAVYGLAPGMLIGLQRDLTEPMAYALAAGGLLALSGRSRHRYLVAGVAFGLAALARQTTLVIPLVWAVWTMMGWDGEGEPLRPRLARAALLAGLAAVPYAAWWLYLRGWLGPSSSGEEYVLWPFGWLVAKDFELGRQPPMALSVVVPGVLCGAAALWALRRGALRPEWACLALHVVAFVVFAPPFAAITSASRAVLGVVLLAVLCVPFLDDLPPPWRRTLAVACVLYMVMAPVMFAYGLTSFRV